MVLTEREKSFKGEEGGRVGGWEGGGGWGFPMTGLETNHVISGPMRGLTKRLGNGQTDILHFIIKLKVKKKCMM